MVEEYRDRTDVNREDERCRRVDELEGFIQSEIKADLVEDAILCNIRDRGRVTCD